MQDMEGKLCLLHAKFTDCYELRYILETVREIIDKVILKCNSQEFTIRSCDSTKTCFVFLKLKSDFFEEYLCRSDCNIEISIKSLFKFIKLGTRYENLTLQYYGEDKLEIKFENRKLPKVSFYSLKLINVESEDEDKVLPIIDYDACVTVSAADFRSSIIDLLKITKTAIKIVVKNNFIIQFFSENINEKACITIEAERKSTIKNVTDSLSIWISTNVIRAPIKNLPLSMCSSVTLCMRPDSPLLIYMTLKEKGYIKLFCAPMIPDE